jgi:hypothetical protein
MPHAARRTPHAARRTPHAARLGLLVSGLFASLRPEAAVAQDCGGTRDWLKGDITWIHLPTALPVSGGHVRVQLVEMTTTAWHEPIAGVLCHPGLPVSPPPSNAVQPCSAVGMTEVHPSWATIWQSIDPSLAGGSVSPTHPNRTQHLWGLFDYDAGQLWTERVQTAAPSCGVRMMAGLPHQPEVMLDNLGVGLQTFNGDLASDTIDERWIWASGGGTPTGPTFHAEEYRVSGDVGRPVGPIWWAQTPGFVLPDRPSADGIEPAWALRRQLSVGGSWLFGPKRVVGTLAPSRVSYGRVVWDFLWHGTCQDAPNFGAHCLPAGHPREVADPTILNTTECTCSMTCPNPATATGPSDGQVKYDHELILDFIDRVTVAPGIAELPILTTTIADLQLRQQVALRVNAFDAGHPDLPAFLSVGCGLTEDDEGGPWIRLDEQSPTTTLADQIALLADSLGNPLSAIAAPQSSHAAFAGLSGHPDVFSIDIGSVGGDGEWTRTGRAASAFLADQSGSCVTSSGGACVVDYTTGAWWETVIDGWNNAFPLVNNGPAGQLGPGPSLVGKVLYSDDVVDAVAPSPPCGGGDAVELCYTPEQYVVGVRGSWSAGTAPGAYSGRRNGARYDAWWITDVRNNYWAGTSSPSTEDDVAVFQEALASRHASVQQEVGSIPSTLFTDRNFEDASAVRDEFEDACGASGIGNRPIYGYWDIDEAFRFSKYHGFSLFNLKPSSSASLPWLDKEDDPFTADPRPTPFQVGRTGFCDCSPWPDGTCTANLLRDLLLTTGHRLHFGSRSIRSAASSDTSIPWRMTLVNRGNASPYAPYELQFAWVDRDAFDIEEADAGQPNGWKSVHTFPRDSRAPFSGVPLKDLFLDVSVGPTPTVVQPMPTVDVRKVQRALRTVPPVTADRTDNPAPTPEDPTPDTCESDVTDTTCSGHSWGTFVDGDYEDAWAYPAPTCTQATTPTGLVIPGPCIPRAAAYLFSGSVQTPPVTSTKQLLLLVRFRDLSRGDPGEDVEAGVHLDLPMAPVVGDASTQRWYPFAFVEVAP